MVAVLAELMVWMTMWDGWRCCYGLEKMWRGKLPTSGAKTRRTMRWDRKRCVIGRYYGFSCAYLGGAA